MATRGSKRYEIITHYKADIALNTLNGWLGRLPPVSGFIFGIGLTVRV